MKKTDRMVVRGASGRRRFITVGAGILLGGSKLATAQEEEPMRYDCDGRGSAVGKNAEVEGNDNDSGATADRPGCGRRPAVMTQYNKKSPQRARVGVKKVIV